MLLVRLRPELGSPSPSLQWLYSISSNNLSLAIKTTRKPTAGLWQCFHYSQRYFLRPMFYSTNSKEMLVLVYFPKPKPINRFSLQINGKTMIWSMALGPNTISQRFHCHESLRLPPRPNAAQPQAALCMCASTQSMGTGTAGVKSLDLESGKVST